MISMLLGCPGVSAQETAESGEARGSVVWRNENTVTKAWTTMDGLPSNRVTALAQTTDGYLWVGTSGGLARFDGNRFVIYGENEGIPRIPIEKLVALPDGRLWVQNVAFSNYWLENGRFVKESRNIIEVKAGQDGEIYAYDQQTVFSLNDEQGERIKIPTPERLKLNFAELAISKDGTIWLLQLDKETTKVWRWRNGMWDEWRGHTAASHKPLVDWLRILAARDGSLWFGTHVSHLIHIQENGQERLVHLPKVPDIGINTLLEGKDGAIWAAPSSGGLYRYIDGALTLHPLSENPDAMEVITLLEGAHGEIWAGTESGGLLKSQRSLVKYHRVDGTPNVQVNALLMGEKDDIIVGTEDRGVFRWSATGPVPYAVDNPANEGDSYVLCLLKSKSETIWIGGSEGLQGFKGGEKVTDEKFASTFMFAQDSVACILQADDGSIWVGSYSGALKIIKNGELKSVSVPTDSAIFDLEMDSYGNIWAATFRGGVLKFDKNRVCQFFGRDKGVPEAALAALYQDGQKTLWLGSDGGGLYFWRDGSFHPVRTTRQGELGSVLQMQEDKEGWLWLGTTHGICGMDVSKIRQGGSTASELVWLRAADGMANEQCTRMQAIKDSSGRLYFGTMDGFVSFDPSEVKHAQMRPKALIEEIQVEEMPLILVGSAKERYEMPPGARFAFRFTGLPPEQAELMRFRYRLSGMGSNWVNLGQRRFVEFSSSPPGNYRLEVQAGTRRDWSPEIAALDLRVRPFYWQTWWFRAAMALLGVLAVVILMKTLERRRMRHVLAALERERAVNEERDRIARDLHDGLGAGLTQANILVEEWGKPESATRIKDRLRSLARELDNAVWLTDSTYDRLPAVCDYLAAYAQNWFQGTGLRCFLDLPHQIPDIQIPQETRQHLFQAVKECLNNVLKHAKASEVNFSLHTSETNLRVIIRDNGRGFDPDEVAKKGRHGLKNIHQRLERIHGKAKFSPSPQGTTVELTLPYTIR